MKSDWQVTEIKSALKQIMRRRGVKYSDLAEHLGVSLPTIKRIMSSEELSLTRLVRICDFLDVSLEQLAHAAEMFREGDRVQFTEEQEEALYESPETFKFFMEYYSLESADEIKATHGLSRKVVQHHLQKLKKLDLVEFDSHDRPRLTHRLMPKFNRENPKLAKLYYRSIFVRIFEHYTTSFERESESTNKLMRGHTSFSVIPLHPSSIEKFRAQIKSFTEELNKQSELDGLNYDKAELDEVILSIAATFEKGGYAKENKVLNFYGEIKDRIEP